jgi:hypothetical protein
VEYEEYKRALKKIVDGWAALSEGLRDDPIEWSVRYLRMHYAEQITVEEMAEKCFLTQN